MKRALPLLAAVLVAGCTTVSRTALVAGSAGTQPGQSATPGETTPGGGTVAGGGTQGLTATTVGSGGGGGGGGGAQAAPEAPFAGTPTGNGTAAKCTKTVKLGFSYSSDEAAGLAAVGNPTAAGAASGTYIQDQQTRIQRGIDDLNRRGGLAGCKVVPVYHDFKSLSSAGFSGESQTECADFAEDQHVFAVITGGLENRTLITCLAQHHVPVMFDSIEYNPVAADFATYRGYLYHSFDVNPSRWSSFIDLYNNAGYFDKGAKVGILLDDDGSGNNQHLVNDLWKPKLAALGITPVVFTFSAIEGFSDTSSVSGQMTSAVLEFKRDGVDHVMTTPDGGDVVVFFTQVAQSQNFHPRYALTSLSAASAWNSEPAGQLPRAVAISFSMLDLGTNNPSPTQLASVPPNPARTACNALFTGHTGANPVTSIYNLCDDLNFLGAALAGASDVTPGTLLAGAEKLGTSLPLASGYTNATFHPGKYDGGSSVRVMLWDTPSNSFKFVSPPEPIP